MLTPLEQWYCDVCGEVIEKPEDGYVVWQNDAQAGDHSFTIIHQSRCDRGRLSASPEQTVSEIIEVVSAECAYGMNVFKDLFAGIRDIVGGRSGAVQNTLRDARRTCMIELRREALMIGADAVVGVRLDYQEVSGGGKSTMLLLVASGTAVKTQRI